MSLARHTAYNLVSTTLPVGIALVTVPLYLATIGAERYGALSICWLLLGYLGALDLGLGRAMAQRIAATPVADADTTGRIVSTGIALSLALATAAALLLLAAGQPLFRLVGFDVPAIAGEMRRTVPLLAATLPLTILSGALNGALMGRSRFGFIGAVELASSSALSIAPLLTARLIGPDLPLLVATALLVRAAALPVLALGCRRELQVRLHRPDRRTAGALLGFGGWVTVSGVVSPVLSLWDRFAIGAALGAAAVATYVVPANLLQRMSMLPDALARAMFPRLAQASESDRIALSKEAVAAISTLMTPVMLGVIAFAWPLLHLWVGRDFAASSAPVAQVLAVGLWVNAFAFIAYATLHATGRPRAAAINHLVEVVPYLIVLWMLVRWLGVTGAALAWSLRTSLDLVLMTRAVGHGLAPLRRIVVPGAIVVAAGAVATLMPFASPIRWIALAILLLAGLANAWMTMPAVMLRQVEALVARLRRRESRAPR